jgi:hypothetical protein
MGHAERHALMGLTHLTACGRGETTMSYPHLSVDCAEHHDLVRDFGGNRPPIICLCGSTRFWEAFRDRGLRLTLEGCIVLSIGICAPDSMVLAHPDTDEGKEQKRKLDELHKRKIDLCDNVFVLNIGGYIGSSTRSEIDYALAHGKTVDYLEPV